MALYHRVIPPRADQKSFFRHPRSLRYLLSPTYSLLSGLWLDFHQLVRYHADHTSILAKLGKHLPVICMAKDMEKVFYRYNGKWVRLSKLYSLVRKRPGKAKVLASIVTETTKRQKVKIVFVRHRHKKRQWLAILSTCTTLPDDETVSIYGKRLELEVFFKMMKHYLNLEREVQLRDYDGIVGHVTIVMTRYVFLAFEQRCHDDPRTLGTLFLACCEEAQDLGLLEAMERLFNFAMEKMRAAGIVVEDAALALVDTVMAVAVAMLHSGKRLLNVNNAILTG